MKIFLACTVKVQRIRPGLSQFREAFSQLYRQRQGVGLISKPAGLLGANSNAFSENEELGRLVSNINQYLNQIERNKYVDIPWHASTATYQSLTTS